MSAAPEKIRHSRTSKILVLVCGGVLFLFLLVSLFIGRVVEFKETVTIAAAPDQILPAVSDLRAWRKWSVWDDGYYTRLGSSPVYQDGPQGEAIGSVERQIDAESKFQVIVMNREEMTPERVMFSYSFWDGEREGDPLLHSTSTFTLTPVAGGTEVTWHYRGDYDPVMGINPLQKYFLLFTQFSLSRAYRESLAGLKASAESPQSSTIDNK